MHKEDLRKIVEAVRRMSGTYNAGETMFVAEVKKVDAKTCDVAYGDAILTKVKLQAFESENGLLMKPVVGSVVLVADLSAGKKRELLVLMYSSIDTTELNGGKNGGVPVAQNIEDNLKSIKNYVEKMSNALPGAFSAIGATTGVSGALGAQAYNTAMLGATMQIKNMENEKFKH